MTEYAKESTLTKVLVREFAIPPQGELRLLLISDRISPGVRVCQRLTQNNVSEASSSDSYLNSSTSAPSPRRPDHQAEIFGYPLPPQVWISLPSSWQSIGIYSATGTTIAVEASPPILLSAVVIHLGEGAYVQSLLQFHYHLEYHRTIARRSSHSTTDGSSVAGPRVLWTSSFFGCGKSTALQTLANYAVRLGYHPLVVDLDTDTPHFGFPDSISTFCLQYMIDPEDGVSFFPGQHWLVGGPLKEERPDIFRHAVNQLIGVSYQRMRAFPKSAVGGMFIDYGVLSPEAIRIAEQQEASESSSNAASHSSSHPIDILLETVLACGVDHLVVQQSAWLVEKIRQRAGKRFAAKSSHSLRRLAMTPDAPFTPEMLLQFPPQPPSQLSDMANNYMTILFPNGLTTLLFWVPANESAVRISGREFRRYQRWMQYFFGLSGSKISASSIRLPTEAVRFYTLTERKEQRHALRTMLPLGEDEENVTDKSDSNEEREMGENEVVSDRGGKLPHHKGIQQAKAMEKGEVAGKEPSTVSRSIISEIEDSEGLEKAQKRLIRYLRRREQDVTFNVLYESISFREIAYERAIVGISSAMWKKALEGENDSSQKGDSSREESGVKEGGVSKSIMSAVSWVTIPNEEFETHLREAPLLGFAIVLNTSPLQLAIPTRSLSQLQGITLLLTSSAYRISSGKPISHHETEVANHIR